MKKKLLDAVINKKKENVAFAIITNLENGEGCIFEKGKPLDKNFIKFEKNINLYFDKKKNGIIDGKELTKESKIIAQQMEKRKTTEQAVVMLIPVALILGLITFGIAVLFSKMKVINDNEINYSK